MYLREIVVGMQENVIFWFDELIYAALDPSKALQPSELTPQKQYHIALIKFIFNSAYQYNVNFIIKT